MEQAKGQAETIRPAMCIQSRPRQVGDKWRQVQQEGRQAGRREETGVKTSGQVYPE